MSSSTDTIAQIEKVDVRMSAPDFRDGLVRNLLSRFAIRLKGFMAKADEYPRFVWQDFLLSYPLYVEKFKESEDGFGKCGLTRLKHILDAYPDVLQRELMRDRFQLGKEDIAVGERHACYEDLQARAVRQDVVKPVKKPERRGERHDRYEYLQARVLPDQQDVVKPVKKPERRGKRHDRYEDLQARVLPDQQDVVKPVKKPERRGERPGRYGLLHAAVLSNRQEIVKLIKSPDEFREKICTLLTSTTSEADLFDPIRRAVLWSHMHILTHQYANVARFLMEFSKAWKLSQIESLRRLIDNTADQIDKSDGESTVDPWMVVLAWASTPPPNLSSGRSGGRSHIIAEFSERQPDVFQDIINGRRQGRSLFRYFLLDDVNKRAEFKSQREELDKMELTADSIVKILVLNCKSGHAYEDCLTFMHLFFLDQLSERTPVSCWSPLHFAAARGNHEMIELLTQSCDDALDKLPAEGVKETYIKILRASFFDAKYMTPLHHAVSGNHCEVVKCLMKWKFFQPCVNEIDIFVRTPFQMACSDPERAVIVEQLTKNYLVDVNTKDCCSFTSLHWAVDIVSPRIVNFLVSFEGSEWRLRTTVKSNTEQNAYDLAVRAQEKAQEKAKEKAQEEAQENNEHFLELIRLDLLRSPAVKDEVDALNTDRKVCTDALNAIVISAILVATVTFGGWLAPPFADGEASYRGVSLFWAFSSLSFFFSIGTVMSATAAVIPVSGGENLKDSVERIRLSLVVTASLLTISIALVLGAFVAAGFSALSPLPQLRNNMTITSSCGGLVCGIIGLQFCFRLWKSVGPGLLNPMFKEAHKWLTSWGEKQPSAHSDLENELYITDTVWNSIPKIGSPQPNGLVRESIAAQWKEIHHLSKKCPLRLSYKGVDSRCSREILDFSTDEKGSLKEYVRMWGHLSQEPVQEGTISASVLVEELEKPG